MLLSGLLIVLVSFNMAFDRASAQFYVDVEHSMPRIGKRNPSSSQPSNRLAVFEPQQQHRHHTAIGAAAVPLLDEDMFTNEAVEILRELLISAAIRNGAASHHTGHQQKSTNMGMEEDETTSQQQQQPTTDYDTSRLVKILRNKQQQQQQQDSN